MINKIEMNHIKTTLCGNFIGIDKLVHLKLLQGDPMVNEFDFFVQICCLYLNKAEKNHFLHPF